MAIQDLKVWCEEAVNDGVTNTDNRRDITSEESQNGWVRGGSVSTQQLNSMFYLTSLCSSPYWHTPFLVTDTVTLDADVALEMNGQAITQGDNPELYAIYGSTLPDMSTDAPSGFYYAVRNL
jgi:hypothetical protein